MDLLIRHYQNKKSKVNNTTSICEIKLYQYDSLIHYIADFSFDYLRYGTKNILTVHHGFTINLKNGDINTYYQLSNYSVGDPVKNRGKNNVRKNNFDSLLNLINHGVYKGEKRRGFWGKKYDATINKITSILIDKIKPEILYISGDTKFYEQNYVVNPLFDLLVDFHLSKKKIKYHDGIYSTIQNEYPKQKWLKLNENKFLPAVLDSYGIKSKYLVAELNKNDNSDIDIKSLCYICKLFGEGYVDYLRQSKWVNIVKHKINFKKYYTLKNEKEKSCLIKVFNNWHSIENTSSIYRDDLIEKINKVLTVREFLESKGFNFKFNATDYESLEQLLNKFENIRNHFKKGYKVRYSFPEDFINEIESDIVVGEKTFKVRLLKTEEDFFMEGFEMKNCMSKQFNKGVVYMYISMRYNKIKINLEYKKGNLIMFFGKANTPVDGIFETAIKKLTEKMVRHSNISWKKEKYDYITK